MERGQDVITRTTDPQYWAFTELEMQAGRMYNRKIFYRFQKQIKFSNKLHLDEIDKGVRYEIYKTQMLQLREFRPRKYVVCVDMEKEDFVCICSKFEKDGIVCAHILRVLVHLNIAELPEKYYIPRWKPKDRKEIRERQFNVPIDMTTANRQLRYSHLSRRLNNIASDGVLTDRKYAYVAQKAKEIEERLDEMTLEDELAESQQKHRVKTAESAKQPHEDGYGDFLQDPDVAPSKGRPESAKRQKTFMEELRSTNKITCSHCRSQEHNIATCTNLHIPRSEFENKNSKKKTTTGNSI